ncbi:MAG: alpha/beta hydrolase [Propionivibrio sp.]
MLKDCLVRNNVIVSGNEASGQTICFVHGLGTDQSAWRTVSEAFAKDFAIVAFDHVGATEANRAYFMEHQSRYLSLSGYVDDFIEICSLPVLRKPAILVGHSLGAMVCLLASLKKPEFFSRLVLIGASPCYQNKGEYLGGMEMDDINAVYRAIHDDYAGWARTFAPLVMGNPEHPQLAQHFHASIASIPREMMLTVLCSILQQDFRESIKRVAMPTLIIQSRNDLFVPHAVAGYLHRHIVGSQLAEIEASGHLPHVSAPDEVIKAIRAFVPRIDGKPPRVQASGAAEFTATAGNR